MKKLLLTLTALLILATSSTSAADWYYVGNGGHTNGQSSFSAFIDNERVLKDNKGAVIWIKYNYNDGTKMIEECYFDRKYITVTTFYRIVYDENGKVIYSGENSNKKFIPIVPETVYERIFNLIW